MSADQIGRGLARAFLDGGWDPGEMAKRGRTALGLSATRRVPAWLTTLTVIVVHEFPARPADRPRDLGEFIGACRVLDDEVRRRRKMGRPLTVRQWATPRTEMREVVVDLPTLNTVGDVADWLALSVGELDWFADCHSLERQVADERLRHYRYRYVPTRTGGTRLLEAPKPRLAALQRRVLHELLDRFPLSPAAHGFRVGRSVASYAAPHADKQVLLHMDLEGFFATISAARVYGVFRSVGLPEPVAYCLAGLTTNAAPRPICRFVPRPARPELLEARRRLQLLLAHPHLAQGAPTSPALANLCARGVDRRLTGLAASWGADYTRYADDLAFSGSRALADPRFAAAVTEIVTTEGFRVATHKTRIRFAHQQQLLTGLVVNAYPQPPRAEVDLLRATLHSVLRDGPVAANRGGHPDFADHLRGRIAWVEAHNAARGARLRAQFDAINW